jgi:cleavage stimulation factor subunit 3
MMEFHSNKDSAVAIKIFDLGAKKFPNEVDYVIRHLQFLLSINDDTSESSLVESNGY